MPRIFLALAFVFGTALILCESWDSAALAQSPVGHVPVNSDPIGKLAASWPRNTWHSACPQEMSHCSFASLISSNYYNIANFDSAVADANTGYCDASPCQSPGTGVWSSAASVAASGDQGSGVNPQSVVQQWAYSAAAQSSDGQVACENGGGHSVGADGSIYCIDLVAAAQSLLSENTWCGTGPCGGKWYRALASGRLIDACAVKDFEKNCSRKYNFTENVPAWVHITSTPGPNEEHAAFIATLSPAPSSAKMGNFFAHSYFASTMLPNHIFVPGGTFTTDVHAGACCIGGAFPFHVDSGTMDPAAPIYVAPSSTPVPYQGTVSGYTSGAWVSQPGGSGTGVNFPKAVCPNGNVVVVSRASGGATTIFDVKDPASSNISFRYSEATSDAQIPPADVDALCLPDPVRGSGHFGLFYQTSPTTFFFFSDVGAVPGTTCSKSGPVKCWEAQPFSGDVPSNCSKWSYSALSGFGTQGLAYDSKRGKVAYTQGDGHICEIGTRGGGLGADPTQWIVTELTSTPTGDLPANPSMCTLLPTLAYDPKHDLFVVDVCGGEWWYKP